MLSMKVVILMAQTRPGEPPGKEVGCCVEFSLPLLMPLEEGGTVLQNVGDWLLCVTEQEVIFC